MTKEEILKLGETIHEYCKKFNVPVEFLFEILEDQKVTPMIRGKAMEYNAFLILDKILPKTGWSIQKLNLNAQQGTYDEDISITHRRTGIILKVESKSAVRGSISDGRRSRKIKVPHFKVKCHRSRSNISLVGTSNDRYSVDSFDMLITTPTNAIYQGKTVGEDLEVVHNDVFKQMLYEFYVVDNDLDLIKSTENDWRFCIPEDIAEEGFVPRTPYVVLNNDSNWRPVSELEKRLIEVVNQKRQRRNQTSRRS
ncbi:MAG: hypothetical protein K8S16_00285 [Bacteroidales bacterium]|nr:hypothetical protein [Bacteroidales bacterium]